jgi:HEPN domain-containing protein
VVREAQELVELALKGMLRAVGVEPPKVHDVGALLVEQTALFAADARGDLPRAAAISKRLRRDRELAFCGDVDFIPTEEYTGADAGRAYDDAAWAVRLATGVIERLAP